MRRIILALAFLASACQGDETISAFTDPQLTFVLREIDGTPFAARATISFPEAGRVAGRAPCNSYGADQTVPYPWFKLGPIMSTRMACADLAAEGAFFAALSEMTLSEVLGGTLILSNDAGREMIFSAQE